jgi:hypothetical protein
MTFPGTVLNMGKESRIEDEEAVKTHVWRREYYPSHTQLLWAKLFATGRLGVKSARAAGHQRTGRERRNDV